MLFKIYVIFLIITIPSIVIYGIIDIYKILFKYEIEEKKAKKKKAKKKKAKKKKDY